MNENKELLSENDQFKQALPEYVNDLFDTQAMYDVVTDYLSKAPTPRQAIEKLPRVIKELEKSPREVMTAKVLTLAYDNLVKAVEKLEAIEDGKTFDHDSAITIQSSYIIYEGLKICLAMIHCFKDGVLGKYEGYRH